MKKIHESKKITIEKCKQHWKNRNYTDQQVKQIRDFLYHLAEIEIRAYLKKKENEAAGNNIQQGINGRASPRI